MSATIIPFPTSSRREQGGSFTSWTSGYETFCEFPEGTVVFNIYHYTHDGKLYAATNYGVYAIDGDGNYELVTP